MKIQLKEIRHHGSRWVRADEGEPMWKQKMFQHCANSTEVRSDEYHDWVFPLLEMHGFDVQLTDHVSGRSAKEEEK